MEIEREQAKRRQQGHGGTAPGKPKSLMENVPEVSGGAARDKVGEALGVSGKTVEAMPRGMKIISRAGNVVMNAMFPPPVGR